MAELILENLKGGMQVALDEYNTRLAKHISVTLHLDVKLVQAAINSMPSTGRVSPPAAATPAAARPPLPARATYASRAAAPTYVPPPTVARVVPSSVAPTGAAGFFTMVLGYSLRQNALFGDTRRIKDQLKELGCNYNPNLTFEEGKKKTPGWVFTDELYTPIMRLISTVGLKCEIIKSTRRAERAAQLGETPMPFADEQVEHEFDDIDGEVEDVPPASSARLVGRARATTTAVAEDDSAE